MRGMYVKITRSGKRQYLQLVEAVRENGKPRQRHVATLGRLDQLLDADVDALVNGLLKATGRAPLGAEHAAAKPDEVAFSPALALGDLWCCSGCGNSWAWPRRSSPRCTDAECASTWRRWCG